MDPLETEDVKRTGVENLTGGSNPPLNSQPGYTISETNRRLCGNAEVTLTLYASHAGGVLLRTNIVVGLFLSVCLLWLKYILQ